MRVAILLLFAGTSTLFAQAAVEAALGASRATTTAAPAAGLGKSIGGAFGNLDKALKSGDKSGDTATKPATEVVVVRSSPATAAKPKAPAKTYEDIAKVEVGLDYAELMQRFGPASLEVAGEGGIRKLFYSGKDGSTNIEVKDGKVASVDAPKPQPGVVALPKQ